MGELSEKILRANEAAWRDRAKRAEADLAQANATIAELRARHEQACAVAVGLREVMERVLARFYTGHTSTGVDGCNDCDEAARIRAALADAAPLAAEHDARVAREAFTARDEAWRLMLAVGNSESDLAIAEHDAKVRAAALEEAAEAVGVNGLGAELTARRIRALAATTPTGTKETT